jgi:hypothetical protein
MLHILAVYFGSQLEYDQEVELDFFTHSLCTPEEAMGVQGEMAKLLIQKKIGLATMIKYYVTARDQHMYHRTSDATKTQFEILMDLLVEDKELLEEELEGVKTQANAIIQQRLSLNAGSLGHNGLPIFGKSPHGGQSLLDFHATKRKHQSLEPKLQADEPPPNMYTIEGTPPVNEFMKLKVKTLENQSIKEDNGSSLLRDSFPEYSYDRKFMEAITPNNESLESARSKLLVRDSMQSLKMMNLLRTSADGEEEFVMKQ